MADSFFVTAGVHGFYQEAGRFSMLGLRPYLRTSIGAVMVGAGPILGVQTESGRSMVGLHLHGGLSVPISFGSTSHLGTYFDLMTVGLDFFTDPGTGHGARNVFGSVFNAGVAAALAIGAWIYADATSSE